ncbi:MAG: toxin-antitoxin system HicB family antitoxin [Chlorobium sp.]|nr:toxin-antitoxin system HicB family antitoxin [Chlorobium sp.]
MLHEAQLRGIYPRAIQRLPKTIHSRLVMRAKQEGVSMNSLVTSMLAESLGKRETVEPKIDNL